MSPKIQRSKRIFLSDIHLGDDRSLNPGPGLYPYCWMKPPRTQMLECFLDHRILRSADVKELIILGDMFDQWVCPAEKEPARYDEISGAAHNKGIMDKLRQIARSPDVRLIYVPGNHDMLIDLEARDFFKRNISGLVYLGKGPGQGVFAADGIAAEHGSMYTLFCSPDTWSRPGGWLPLGFYISRAAAYKNEFQGGEPDPWDIVVKFIKHFIGDPELSKSVFLAIAKDAGLNENSPIAMNDLDHVAGSITAGAVAERYPRLLKTWQPIPPVDTKPGDALLNEISGLDGPAQSEYFLKKRASIVVFGHTHREIIAGYLRQYERCDVSFMPTQPCDCIYANSGTWINSHKTCSYVETEIDADRGKHFVRLFHYLDSGKSKKIGQRFINLPK